MKAARDFADETYSMTISFAKKGTMLPRTIVETLAEAKDLDDLAARLKGTIYSEAVSKLGKNLTAERLEMAFREHLAFVHYSMVKASPNSALLAAYYMKHVSWNLKNAVKGKALGKGYDEIAPHINLYAEELIGRRDLVVKALSAKDLDEAVGLLKGTEFGSEVEDAARLYKEKGDIHIFDTYLDRAFLQGLLAEYRALRRTADYRRVTSLIAVDIDSYNAITALRGRIWDLSAPQLRELMIEPTFYLGRSKLEAIITAGSMADAVKRLTETPYRKIVPAGVSGEDLIARLEDEFQLYIYRQALHPFLWQVSGLGVSLGLVKLKELEVRNLSAIAFGVEAKVGFQNIMAKLTVLP